MGAGLFVATFRLGGAWFDIARVDMLFVALLLAAQVALLYARRGEVWAGVLFALAFYTKQTALLVVVPLAAVLTWRRGWPAGLELVLSFLLVAGHLTALEQWRSGGWYAYYVFGLPRHHALAKPLLDHLALHAGKLFELLPVAAALGLAYAVLGRRDAWKRGAEVSAAFVLALVAPSVGAKLTYGCYDNVSVPGFAGLAIALGVAGHWLEGRSNAPVGKLAVLAACAAQFIVLGFDPSKQVPSAANLRAGQALVEQLRRIPGEVLIPAHNDLALAAGKAPFAHEIAPLEVQGEYTAGGFAVDGELEAALRRELDAGRFAAVILDSDGASPLWRSVYQAYQSRPLGYPHHEDFWPVTGMSTATHDVDAAVDWGGCRFGSVTPTKRMWPSAFASNAAGKAPASPATCSQLQATAGGEPEWGGLASRYPARARALLPAKAGMRCSRPFPSVEYALPSFLAEVGEKRQRSHSRRWPGTPRNETRPRSPTP